MIPICLLAMVTSGASLIISRLLITNLTQSEEGAGQDLADARAIQLMGIRDIASSHACLLVGGARYGAEAQDRYTLVRDRAEQLRSRVADSAGRALLDTVLVDLNLHHTAFQQALPDSRQPASTPRSLLPEPVLAKSVRLDQALADLVTHLQRRTASEFTRHRTSEERAETMLVFITVATVVLLAFLCLLLVNGLNRSYLKQSSARTDAETGQSVAQANLTEVEAASHLKDEFLATVSHELRNPLAPILTWTQLLRSGTLDEVKTQRALEVIERNVISQSQLIDDLVDVSRVVSGKFRLDVRPLDLVGVIRAAADSQAPASDAKQIRLQLVLDERAGMISGDSERIQQVMWNLVSNAIKFTPRGGRVQVVLQRSESHIEIVVSDSGIGIDAAFLPHVFEPFRQGMGGSMRRHGGLGLGLSIVRHIVELHGGTITVESPGLNKGSTFMVKFPLLAMSAAAGESTNKHPIAGERLAEMPHVRLDGVRVLVVDDESNASEALVVLFASCGADARAAGSVPEALTLFDAWRPDVLLSDVAMPGEDGYSLIRKIRMRSPQQGGHTPAAALTAYAKVEDRVSILAAGFQMYLSKPANPTELVAVVSSLARSGGTQPRAAS